MDSIPSKTQYDGSTLPVPDDAVHTADQLNDRIVEMEGSVTDSGQALDVLDAGQLSKTMFANAVAAQSMLDSGGVNSVVLTPITGASGLRVATPLIKTYALLEGAIFSFKANNTNAGNMTANVGQTAGTVIGAQPLFQEDGSTEVPAGFVVAGKYYNIRYDSSLDVDGAFVLLNAFPGRVIQEVNFQTGASATGSTTITLDDSIPQNTEGNQFMSLAFTPTNSSSKLKIEVVANVAHSSGGQNMVAALFKDADAGALAAISEAMADGSIDPRTMMFTHYMTAGTVSAVTFKVRVGSTAGGTTTFNGSGGSRKLGGVMASSITITELSQ